MTDRPDETVEARASRYWRTLRLLELQPEEPTSVLLRWSLQTAAEIERQAILGARRTRLALK